MNKAFLREPESTADFCPRCGSRGEPVGSRTLAAWLSEPQRRGLADSANFCPSAQCPVAYFDGFERVVLAVDLPRPAWPKEPAAPICACFGLTRADIEQDVREGVVTRTRAVVEKARSAEAHCLEAAANGRPCVAYVQKYYLQCRQAVNSKTES